MRYPDPPAAVRAGAMQLGETATCNRLVKHGAAEIPWQCPDCSVRVCTETRSEHRIYVLVDRHVFVNITLATDVPGRVIYFRAIMMMCMC